MGPAIADCGPTGFVFVDKAASQPPPESVDNFDAPSGLDNVSDNYRINAQQRPVSDDHEMHIDRAEPHDSATLPVPFPPMPYASNTSSNPPFYTASIPHVPLPEARAADDRYNALLHRIDDQRWSLRDQRESLHGGRVRLHARRQDLRETIDRTMMQVDMALKLLEQFWLDRDAELPKEIRSAFESANLWSAELERTEKDFRKAEKAYDLDEWDYTEQESKFVDDMYADEPFARDPSGPGFLGIGELTQHAFGDDPKGTLLMAAETKSSQSQSQSVVDVMAEEPASEQDTLQSTLIPDSNFVRSMTSQSLNALNIKPTTRFMTRPYSENDLTLMKLEWSDTRARIEEWLFDALEQSTIQKDLLRRLTDFDGLNFQDWWKLVRYHWRSDSPSDVVFHTGDTTVPPTTTGCRTSVIDVIEVHVPSGEGTPEPQMPLQSPLVSLDRLVDAFEDIDFPKAIKPIDLLEPAIETVHQKRTSSTDDHSLSLREVPWQDTVHSEDSPEVSAHGEDAVATRKTQPSDHELSVGLAPVFTAHDTHSNFHGRGNVLRDGKDTSVFFADIRVAQPTLHSIPPSLSKDSGDDLRSTTSSPRSTAYSLRTENTLARDGDSQPEATGERDKLNLREISLFYIEVQDSQTWYLPLLRLTPNEVSRAPSSDTPCHITKNSLQALPFVSNTSFIHRLPGPSSLC